MLHKISIKGETHKRWPVLALASMVITFWPPLLKAAPKNTANNTLETNFKSSAVTEKNPVDASSKFNQAREAFFHAIKLDDVGQMQSLLKRGLPPNLLDPITNDPALIVALREDSIKAFSLLVRWPTINLEAKAPNGDTALMIAAYKGNFAAVASLLEKGAEVNRTGWTALHYAAANGHQNIVSLLLDHSAYIDAESPNKTTPIMMAAWGGHILTVKLLLEEGADARLKNDQGMTAIDFAAKNDHTDIVEGLRYRLKRNSP